MLKWLHSYLDIYESNESHIIKDLFKNNKIEYIHIRTNNNNIIKPMTLSRNIENLRYFYVNNGKNRVDITLDIS